MSVISRSSMGSLGSINTGRLSALNSISSKMHNSSEKLESEEQRFSRKLKMMSTLEREIEEYQDKLKSVRENHAKIETWVKGKMLKKAVTDGTNRVEVSNDNKVYTFERKKTYKKRAPSKKDIEKIIQSFFDETDLAEFMSLNSRQKASRIFERIYSKDNVGFMEKSSFRKRTIIRTPRKS